MRNRAKAEAWYKKGSELGDARAEFQLALMFLHTNEEAKGREWLHQSAQNGNDYAQSHLGNFYRHGQIGLKRCSKSFCMASQGFSAGESFFPTRFKPDVSQRRGRT